MIELHRQTFFSTQQKRHFLQMAFIKEHFLIRAFVVREGFLEIIIRSKLQEKNDGITQANIFQHSTKKAFFAYGIYKRILFNPSFCCSRWVFRDNYTFKVTREK